MTESKGHFGNTEIFQFTFKICSFNLQILNHLTNILKIYQITSTITKTYQYRPLKIKKTQLKASKHFKDCPNMPKIYFWNKMLWMIQDWELIWTPNTPSTDIPRKYLKVEKLSEEIIPGVKNTIPQVTSIEVDFCKNCPKITVWKFENFVSRMFYVKTILVISRKIWTIWFLIFFSVNYIYLSCHSWKF